MIRSQEQQPRLLDHHLAGFLGGRSGLAGEERDRFCELVRQLSMNLAAGDSCLQVGKRDRALLAKSPLVACWQVDEKEEDQVTPLVVDGNHLYLQRYFHYESRLAEQLSRLAEQRGQPVGLDSLLDGCFGATTGEVDYQKEAARVALTRALAIISGGPGTGKTTTVVRILGLLLQAFGPELRIALAAPTGKAAMRLTESIVSSLSRLSFPAFVIDRIPTTASTLHRLLGVRRNRPTFVHHHDNPLPFDVVVVDEASMVDLALMSKLVDALWPQARLILLGDKDQLTSVETGAVLADCIRGLADNTVELKKTYRFDRAIHGLATAINQGDAVGAWALVSGERYGNLSLLRNSYSQLIGDRYLAYMRRAVFAERPDMADIFRKFSEFRVLCATRHGACGVEGVNLAVENHLKKRGYDTSSSPWYIGRPVMVRSNDYNLELFNGDIGICLPDPEDGQVKVWFEKENGRLRPCLPSRIPSYETAWAMTVHKSQGSEFREVVVMLGEHESALLNRQLLYTAVTRAKECVQIVASKTIFVYAVTSDYPRTSGLARMLARTERGRDRE